VQDIKTKPVPEIKIPRLLYSREECAFALGISQRKFDQLVAAKMIPIRRVGKRVFVHRDTLEKFARGK
jgi:excisionase family DNA binding protein